MGERHKAEVEWLRREIDLSVDLRERIEEENERLGAEVEWLRSAVEGLQRAAESDRLRIARLLDELGDKHAEVERLRGENGRRAVAARAATGRIDALEAEVERLLTEYERLREALHRIHRGDPQPWKIAADALTGPTAADDAERTDDHA